MKRSIFRFLVVTIAAHCFSVGIVVASPQAGVQLSTFIDASIAHDFNDLPTRYRPYTTQPYYTDEGALNLGFVDAAYDSSEYRGRLALQYGSSVISNYLGEAEVAARYFQEAYGGVKIGESLTVDVGIFLSHIGHESWISRDNYTLSRSLVSDYSPYYQSGARASYAFSERMKGELHLIRGWQNISSDRNPALGTQISYEARGDLTLIHNSFIGQEHGTRVFNDIVVRHRPSDQLEVGASLDLGIQERRDETTALWHGWALTGGLRVAKGVSIGGRVERFVDPHQVVIQGVSGASYNATGLSANVDIALSEGLLLRSEYRAFFAPKDIFPQGEGLAATDSFVLSSLQYTIR